MSQSLIVAVKSCVRDRDLGFHDAIRGTWGKELRGFAQVRFFIGTTGDQRRELNLKSDETILDCPDDYANLPKKTREICKWAIGRMVDHLFLCDNDTLIFPQGFKKLPYKTYDYAGYFSKGEEEIGKTFYYTDHMGTYPECHPWASGGAGYFLSQKAIVEIADMYPYYWAEDMYVGQTLGPLIQNGTLLAGALDMKGAAEHFRKTIDRPIFTVEDLYKAYQEKK